VTVVAVPFVTPMSCSHFLIKPSNWPLLAIPVIRTYLRVVPLELERPIDDLYHVLIGHIAIEGELDD